MKIKIEKVKVFEIDESLKMVRDVFNEFVGIDYTNKGKETFYNFIKNEEILKRIKDGLLMICAKDGEEIVGIEAVRDNNHISLFFVKKEYQGNRIGRQLFTYSLKELKKKNKELKEITVNSSPYAIEIYKSLGFKEYGDIKEDDGIKYIPMKYIVSG